MQSGDADLVCDLSKLGCRGRKRRVVVEIVREHKDGVLLL